MENVDTSQVVRRQKKSGNFLGILSRRSTKIEPQNNLSSDESLLNSGNSGEENENQQHKQGIFNKKQLERNNTCPALNINAAQDTATNANYLSPRSPRESGENNNRYSFCCATDAEKQMFQALISVNGIGPNTALVVLSYLAPDELKAA